MEVAESKEGFESKEDAKADSSEGNGSIEEKATEAS